MYEGPFSDVLLLYRKGSANCVGHSVCKGYVCCRWAWRAAASVWCRRHCQTVQSAAAYRISRNVTPKCFSCPIPAPILFQVSHTHHAINPHWSTPKVPHEYTIWVYVLLNSHSHFEIHIYLAIRPSWNRFKDKLVYIEWPPTSEQAPAKLMQAAVLHSNTDTSLSSIA